MSNSPEKIETSGPNTPQSQGPESLQSAEKGPIKEFFVEAFQKLDERVTDLLMRCEDPAKAAGACRKFCFMVGGSANILSPLVANAAARSASPEDKFGVALGVSAGLVIGGGSLALAGGGYFRFKEEQLIELRDQTKIKGESNEIRPTSA